MTKTEYQELLKSCNFRDPDQVSKLVTSTHTNVMINDDVSIKTVDNPVSSYNYFGELFGKEEWPDGQGMDEIREYATDSHIPITFSHFIRESEICDPNLANECIRDYCQIPEGGRGTMNPFVFYKWGLKTPRDCIANIRHIRQFKWWARRIIRSRELADEQIMNMFYIMAAIKTSGSKITMQGFRDADGALRMAPSNDPRNPLRYGRFNYMEERFPAPTDLDLLCPLTVDTLQGIARYWAQFPKNNSVATGPRGESIYEFWFPDDWYYTEAVRDRDYVEKLKLTMPAKLFTGYSMNPGEREVVGNFAAKVMPFLPRFAPTNDGRIVPVDSHVGIDIEVGKEYVGSVQFENAPYGMAMIPSSRQGTILTRPTLTESGAGFPINPISGDAGWVVRNDYDKDCNPDLNMPFSQRAYELGFRMDDASASISFLFRRRKFGMSPIQECDLAPIYNVVSNEVDCEMVTIGCQTGKVREQDGITQGPGATFVSCTAASCGNTDSAPYSYILKIPRKPNQPDFNSLGCACGSAVNLFVYDENGEYSRQIQGVYKSDALAFPEARVFIETTVKLADGECIRGISCADDTNLQGNAIDSFDQEDGTVAFILDSPITCGEGDDVVITYYGASGNVLGNINGTIESYDPSRFMYVISSMNVLFKADGVYTGQTSVGVSCNEGPSASSSSSSSSGA